MIHHLVAMVISDGGSGHHYGNGHHNRNVVSVRSPTYNRGYQHTSNGNSGGTNPTQNALCRNVTVCKVSQKVTFVLPPAPPAAEEPTVQTLPEPVVPQRSERAPRLRPPFIYLGPYGFLLMGPDSAGLGFG